MAKVGPLARLATVASQAARLAVQFVVAKVASQAARLVVTLAATKFASTRYRHVPARSSHSWPTETVWEFPPWAIHPSWTTHFVDLPKEDRCFEKLSDQQRSMRMSFAERDQLAFGQLSQLE